MLQNKTKMKKSSDKLKIIIFKKVTTKNCSGFKQIRIIIGLKLK